MTFLKRLPCLFPFAVPHQAHAAHETFLLLNVFIQRDAFIKHLHGFLGLLTTYLQFVSELLRQFPVLFAESSTACSKSRTA